MLVDGKGTTKHATKIPPPSLSPVWPMLAGVVQSWLMVSFEFWFTVALCLCTPAFWHAPPHHLFHLPSFPYSPPISLSCAPMFSFLCSFVPVSFLVCLLVAFFSFFLFLLLLQSLEQAHDVC